VTCCDKHSPARHAAQLADDQAEDQALGGGSLDLLALAELKAVLRPKFAFLTEAEAPGTPRAAPAAPGPAHPAACAGSGAQDGSGSAAQDSPRGPAAGPADTGALPGALGGRRHSPPPACEPSVQGAWPAASHEASLQAGEDRCPARSPRALAPSRAPSALDQARSASGQARAGCSADIDEQPAHLLAAAEEAGRDNAAGGGAGTASAGARAAEGRCGAAVGGQREPAVPGMVPEAADGCGASGQECGRPGCDQPAAACAAACAGAIPDTAAGQERGQREGRAAEAPTGRRGAGGCRAAGRVGVGGGQQRIMSSSPSYGVRKSLTTCRAGAPAVARLRQRGARAQQRRGRQPTGWAALRVALQARQDESARTLWSRAEDCGLWSMATAAVHRGGTASLAARGLGSRANGCKAALRPAGRARAWPAQTARTHRRAAGQVTISVKRTWVATIAAPLSPAADSARQRYLVKHWLAFTRGSGRPATSYTCPRAPVIGWARGCTRRVGPQAGAQAGRAGGALVCRAAASHAGEPVSAQSGRLVLRMMSRPWTAHGARLRRRHQPCSAPGTGQPPRAQQQHPSSNMPPRPQSAPRLLKELRGVEAARVGRLRLGPARHARADAQPACAAPGPPELPHVRRSHRRPRAGHRASPAACSYSLCCRVKRARAGRRAARQLPRAPTVALISPGCAEAARLRRARSHAFNTQRPQRAWQADGEHVGVVEVPGDRVGGQSALAHVVPQQVRRVELALRAPQRRGR